MSERAAALDHVPAGWDSLLAADPSASPAHRPELWSALAAAISGFEWRLLVHREDGGLAAGAPVVLSRRTPYQSIDVTESDRGFHLWLNYALQFASATLIAPSIRSASTSERTRSVISPRATPRAMKR